MHQQYGGKQGKDKEDNMKLSLVSVAVHQGALSGRCGCASAQYGGKQGKDKEDNMKLALVSVAVHQHSMKESRVRTRRTI